MGNADRGTGLADQSGDLFRMGASAGLVDVHAVGPGMEECYIGPEFPEHGGGRGEGGSVGTIHRDLQTVERHPRDARLGDLSILFTRIGKDGDGSDAGSLGAHGVDFRGLDELLKAGLDGVGELVAVATEELESVVGGGIVGGGDHHAANGVMLRHKAGDRRGGNHAGQQGVGADGVEAGNQGRLQHRPRSSRVAADHEAG